MIAQAMASDGTANRGVTRSGSTTITTTGRTLARTAFAHDVRRVARREDVSSLVIDVLACASCGGRLHLIATLHDPVVIRKLLAHLGMARSGPSPGPAPPPP
jgi:hypothetical protein